MSRKLLLINETFIPCPRIFYNFSIHEGLETHFRGLYDWNLLVWKLFISGIVCQSGKVEALGTKSPGFNSWLSLVGRVWMSFENDLIDISPKINNPQFPILPIPATHLFI